MTHECCHTCFYKEVCGGKLLDPVGNCVKVLGEYPNKCPVCNGVGSILIENRRKVCVCQVRRKVIKFLEPLGEIHTISKGFVDRVIECVDKKPLNNVVAFYKQYATSVIAYLLLRERIKHYRMVSVRDMFYVFIGEKVKDDRVSLSLRSLETTETLVIYWSSFEFDYNRFEDAVLNILESRRIRKLTTWIAVDFHSLAFNKYYREVSSYLQDYFTVIEQDCTYHARTLPTHDTEDPPL